MKIAGLTILGTDTEVGKTYAACRIIESLVRDGVEVRAYKPVASGTPTLEQSDGYQLWKATGHRGSIDEVSPQRFLAPLAPPVAAELEGRLVSDTLIVEGARYLADRCEFLLVEGAGGLMSPISWTMSNASLALELNFPVVLVSQNRLGVVNQFLTTLVAAKALGLNVRCVVLNEIQTVGESSTNTNLRMLKTFLDRHPDPPWMTVLHKESLDFTPPIVWQDLADLPMP